MSNWIIDRNVWEWVMTIRTPLLTEFFEKVTFVGNWQVILGLGLIWAAILVKKGQKNTAKRLIVVYLTAIAVNELLKVIIGRNRPPQENWLIEENNFSIPSGHAVFSVLFYGILGKYMIDCTKIKLIKILIGLMVLVLIGLIAFSRIYLGVHWLSDVLVGMMIGGGWIFVYNRIKDGNGRNQGRD